MQSAPTPARQSPAAPVNEAAPVKRAPVPAEKKEEPAQETAKPWIQKTDLGPKLKAISGRLSLREQALQAQTGINPRRGRSLSEVVDEQWRHSRYEQLGHPVPPDATGRPVVTPIDRAHMAVKEAWSIPDARQGLIGVLLKDEELRRALSQQLKIQASRAQGTDDQRMEELEADKLKLIAEIDALRIRRNDMKAQLMEDLRKSHQRDFETLKQRNQALQAQIERNQEKAGKRPKPPRRKKNCCRKPAPICSEKWWRRLPPCRRPSGPSREKMAARAVSLPCITPRPASW